MKVCVATLPAHLSRGIHRVSAALERYAPPGVQIVHGWDVADHVLLHIVGWEDVKETMDRLEAAGKTFSVFQYCYRTTSNTNLMDWWPLWSRCRLVSSYYDLQHFMELAEIEYDGSGNFHHTPLGVDPTVFKPCGCAKQFLVGTSGYVAGQECLNEWAIVAQGRGHFHLGPPSAIPLPVFDTITFQSGMDDAALAKRWSRCAWVSGLRRGEGFELPAFEGLACGARPVMFDRVDSRQWFGEHAVYVKEAGPEELVAQLREVTSRPAPKVSAAEIAWVGERFGWEKVARGWWERLRSGSVR